MFVFWVVVESCIAINRFSTNRIDCKLILIFLFFAILCEDSRAACKRPFGAAFKALNQQDLGVISLAEAGIVITLHFTLLAVLLQI